MTDIIAARTEAEIASARGLFIEYAESLGFSLCFQGFDEELAALPGDYSPPRGRLLLARVGGQPAGCVGLHPITDDICEIKRLYVRPGFRNLGLGRKLTERAIADARTIGYRNLRLDTVEDRMKAAVALYRAMGFREIGPYRDNPIPSALYMELALDEEISAKTQSRGV